MAFQVHEVNLCDYNTVADVLTKASEQAESEGKVMTMARIAYLLGTTRQTVASIADGSMVTYGGKKIPQEVSNLFKNAVTYCELCVNDAGFAAKNPAMSIFVLKAIHNYDDKPQSGEITARVVFVGEDKIPD